MRDARGPDGPHQGRQNEQTVDAWALCADEGRGNAAKSVGEARAPGDPTMSEWGNPSMLMETRVSGREPGELKHLSSRRK